MAQSCLDCRGERPSVALEGAKLFIKPLSTSIHPSVPHFKAYELSMSWELLE